MHLETGWKSFLENPMFQLYSTKPVAQQLFESMSLAVRTNMQFWEFNLDFLVAHPRFDIQLDFKTWTTSEQYDAWHSSRACPPCATISSDNVL